MVTLHSYIYTLHLQKYVLKFPPKLCETETQEVPKGKYLSCIIGEKRTTDMSQIGMGGASPFRVTNVKVTTSKI